MIFEGFEHPQLVKLEGLDTPSPKKTYPVTTPQCRLIASWTVVLTVPLAFQPLELLCEKSIGTANRPMGAGEALRRVLECLASGIVMPGWGLVLCRLQGKDRD